MFKNFLDHTFKLHAIHIANGPKQHHHTSMSAYLLRIARLCANSATIRSVKLFLSCINLQLWINHCS